ncbi:hypothetical protein Y1Q_0001107 [Alligator mississippiensis]|uniref:Uncharacterized protein n=1 Tax=Alligator mississippiensis TaxID=8496 RepID=A0A151M3V2_ALLMI|nr:hypothetical protein Y1Q_0001107 [Alligator mississippiensis]
MNGNIGEKRYKRWADRGRKRRRQEEWRDQIAAEAAVKPTGKRSTSSSSTACSAKDPRMRWIEERSPHPESIYFRHLFYFASDEKRLTRSSACCRVNIKG